MDRDTRGSHCESGTKQAANNSSYKTRNTRRARTREQEDESCFYRAESGNAGICPPACRGRNPSLSLGHTADGLKPDAESLSLLLIEGNSVMGRQRFSGGNPGIKL